MICIGVIVKSHKTSGQFLCRLFNPVSTASAGGHRLSGLERVELRSPGGRSAPAQNLELPLEELQFVGRDHLGQTASVLLRSPSWHSPEQIRPFHAWELWVDECYASPCEEGEFWYRELVGAEVYAHSESGVYCRLANVSAVLEGGAQILLELRLCPERYTQNASMYLPFCDGIIGRVQRREAAQLRIEVLDLEYFEALL